MIIKGNHDRKRYQVIVGSDKRPHLYQNNKDMGIVARIEIRVNDVLMEVVDGKRHELLNIHDATFMN